MLEEICVNRENTVPASVRNMTYLITSLGAFKICKSTFPKSRQLISDFDTFFLTKTKMYVVYRCYFRIMILKTMSLNLLDCPFGIFNLRF
jgi:hypothetical protein